MTLRQTLDRWLVEDWTQAYKWLSMQFGTLLLIWSQLPEKDQAAVLAFLGLDQQKLMGALVLAMLVGRMIAQHRSPPKLVDEA